MVPAPISLAWAPGERLLASAGAQPSCNLEALPALPRPFLNMFFTGHLIFTDRATSPQVKSQRYRSIMLTCRDDIEQDAENNDQQAKQMIAALTDAHAVWHFIEAVFLTDHSLDDRHTSEFLTEWYMVNYSNTMDAINKTSYRLQAERPRDDDDELWDCLLKLAIVGKITQIRQMLFIGKQEDEEFGEDFPFASSDEKDGVSAAPVGPAHIVKQVYGLLERAPAHNISARSDGSWEEWQSSCAMWAEAEELEKHRGARKLLGLLSGDTQKIAEACMNWEEMLVACSLYGQYGATMGGNLRGGRTLVSNSCASASTVYKAPNEVAGGALLEAALGYINRAFVCMQANLPSSWFSAHLCDLVIKAGQMEDKPAATWDTDDRSMGMREFYLKAYARELERYRGCWRIAVDYYLDCPSHGTSLLIDLLSRVPFEGPSDPTVEKVLLICTKKRLQMTARNICERLGAECLNQHNLGGAMSWFARAGLYKRAQGVAELALTKAEAEGANSPAARSLECVVHALASVGDEKMLEMFDYIRVYCEMQKSLVSISSPQASSSTEPVAQHAAMLISSARRLVGGGGLPRRYWVIVAYEVARVIELYPELVPLFSRVAVSELLGALQLASGPHRSQELVAGLHRRLAFDAILSGPENQHESSTPEEAETAMQHCRSVFIRTAAKRINAE